LRAEQPRDLLGELILRRLLVQERGDEVPVLLLVRTRELRLDRGRRRI
jgi:hypothetical protein